MATAPISESGESHWLTVAHLVDEAAERIHAAESADNLRQVRQELYELKHMLDEVLG